ncbi:MAG: MvaI/BcnI restriction endonuclease family protein [Clostridia bacterium]|nr:MvaI/BcnI restriction endonuclease family protein [Clostridia bacterium]
MEKNFNSSYFRFLRIKQLGWIKSMRKGPTGVGYTFEELLNKKEDHLPLPDYKGIEIKTMKCFSKHKIHLFNATPDNKGEDTIKTLVNKLGYPDRTNPEFKVFNVSLNAKEYTKIGYKMIKIAVNHEKEKIELKAYSTYGKNFDLNISWSFKMLEKCLKQKLEKLAIVKVWSKEINNEDYFYYSSISFYKLRDFQTFIKLIEEGIIEVQFKIGIHREEQNLGKTYDRGTDFSIKEENIPLLFEKI